MVVLNLELHIVEPKVKLSSELAFLALLVIAREAFPFSSHLTSTTVSCLLDFVEDE